MCYLLRIQQYPLNTTYNRFTVAEIEHKDYIKEKIMFYQKRDVRLGGTRTWFKVMP